MVLRRCRRRAGVVAVNRTIPRHMQKTRRKAQSRGFSPIGVPLVAGENPSRPGFVFASRSIPSHHAQSRNQSRESGIVHVFFLAGIHVDLSVNTTRVTRTSRGSDSAAPLRSEFPARRRKTAVVSSFKLSVSLAL